MSRRYTGPLRLLSLATLMMIVLATGASSQALTSTPAAPHSGTFIQHDSNGDPTARAMYIVRLAGAPLASYKGGLSGLPATSPVATGTRKLTMKSAATNAYRAHLAQQRQQVIDAISQLVGSAVTVPFIYDVVLHGFALELSGAQARQVATLPGVVAVEQETMAELHTDAGPSWIKAPQVWSGVATNLYVATILGAHEVPSTTSTASGRGTLSYNDATNTLTYNITISGMTATSAHIHRGAAGANGANFHDLVVASPGTYVGSTVLSAADETLLRTAGLYLNFHSTASPAGEIRGQITGSMGEGMLVGMIDTGINFRHPSFAATGGDGYSHLNPFGPGTYKGVCDPASPQYQSTWVCNAKLVGAYTWPGVEGPISPDDEVGHGSHTTSIAAGNVLQNVVLNGVPIGTISGVAPHANIIMYDGCGAIRCPASATVASTNQAVADGVDVINYSIGVGNSSPWTDSQSLAFLNAAEAGVFAAVSAGNAGSNASTIGSPVNAPWVSSVGATDTNRAFLGAVTNLTSSQGTLPDMVGKSFTASLPTTSIVYAGAAPYNNPQCNPFPAGTFTGQIVVCERLGSRIAKSINVRNAGGSGVIIVSDILYKNSFWTDMLVIPGVYISYTDAVALKAWLATGTGHQAAISGRTVTTSSSYADMISGFSSRGPVVVNGDVLKPDLVAPGIDIIGAAGDDGNPANGAEFLMANGTSMAAPHNVGAATLVRSIHPSWSPSEVQSALMTTSIQSVRKEDNVTPATPFDRGAGRIDVSRAVQAGLVLHETTEDFAKADPALGGDAKTLNLASFQNSACVPTCTWRRTLSNTLSTPATWTASYTSTTGLNVTVSPATFTIPAGGTQVIDVSATTTGVAPTTFVFGSFTLTEAANKAPTATFPLAVRPGTSNVAALIDALARFEVGALPSPLITAIAIPQLTIREYGLTKAAITTADVVGDPTPNTIYDNLTPAGGVLMRTFPIPAGTKRLVAEVFASEARDVDMYVHRDGANGQPADGIPQPAELACPPPSSYALEYCTLNDPTPGTYIVVAQNWSASANAPDLISLATVAVPDVDEGNMTVTGPATVPAGTPFTLNVAWNLPGSQVGERWYGAYDVGTDAANPGNLGRTNVDLVRAEAFGKWLPLVSK